MKILMIHSDGAKMDKKAQATSKPGEGPENLDLKGNVLVCFVSVEDQDTFDIDLISKAAVVEIEEAIQLIEGFPDRIEEQNQEIRKLNAGLEKKRKAAEKNRLHRLDRFNPLRPELRLRTYGNRPGCLKVGNPCKRQTVHRFGCGT